MSVAHPPQEPFTARHTAFPIHDLYFIINTLGGGWEWLHNIYIVQNVAGQKDGYIRAWLRPLTLDGPMRSSADVCSQGRRSAIISYVKKVKQF